jgi:malate dehydrogenase
MTTVAIIGAGDIGGATAQALASADRISRILLVDPAHGAASGKALDIQQSGAVAAFHARLEGTGDETHITGCDACIIADRFGGGDWRGDEALAMLVRIAAHLGDVPVIFAGAAHADLLNAAATESPLAARRLVGSSPEALVSALAAIIAIEAACSPGDIAITVLGVPPDQLVVPWGEATVGGYALERAVSQAQLARIQARAARLWPPGPYALGAAAARVAGGLLSSSRHVFTVLARLSGEFGVRNVTGIVPARLGAHGVMETREPQLASRERAQVLTALAGRPAR